MSKPVSMAPRRLACARCGTPFDCANDGSCWCAAEPYRLPMVKTSEDCLCADCLRKAAETLAAGRRVHDDTH
jgi:hypothetical protein